MIIWLDFETFYDSKAGYTLSKMPMVNYIREPRFKVFGLGMKHTGLMGFHSLMKTVWVSEQNIEGVIAGTDWANTWVCGHNIKFDGAILAWKYGVKPKGWIDTLGMAKAVLGTKISSHSLASVAAYYGLTPKGVLKTDGLASLSEAQEAELAEYCLHDVELCAQIFEKMKPEFPASQWQHLDWTVRAFVEPTLRLDVPKLEELSVVESQRREAIFQKVGLPKTEFASNKLFPALLEERGYEVPMKRSPRTGLLIPALSATDEKFMDMFNTENEELSMLCEARLAAKSALLETRTKKFAEVGKTGAWPFDVGFSGATQTHRFSGGSGSGGNPQNIPARGRGKEMRECVLAPSGTKLVVADFSTIEARIVAGLANEPRLSEAFAAGRDVYCEFGSRVFGRTVTKADTKDRFVAKAAVLGLGYCMGAAKFQKTLRMQGGVKMDFGRVKEMVEFYRGYYPAIPMLWRRLEKVLESMSKGQEGQITPFLTFNGPEITLPSGLKLRYPDLRIEDEEFVYTSYRSKAKTPSTQKVYGGKLLENLAQAIAGEICKEAILRIRAHAYVVAGAVHDEVIVVAPHDDTECEQVVYTSMTAPMPWFKELILEAEVGQGLTWAAAKQNVRSLEKETVI